MKKLLLLAAAFLAASVSFAQITVNVQVPAGTPSCFFYGAFSGNVFVEMTKVDDTHYTISFPDKTASDLDWGYKFCWESGNWNTQAKPETTYVNTDGTTCVVEDWQTQPGTSYHYTSYTNWQVKTNWSEGGWDAGFKTLTQVSTGVFRISDVAYNEIAGFNIASDDGPVKKDWYPLSDISVDDNVVAGEPMSVTLTVTSDETVTITVNALTTADEAQADAAEVVAIYNMIGQPVPANYDGVKVIVYSNGKVEKKY